MSWGMPASLLGGCFGFCAVYHFMSCMLEVLGVCPCTLLVTQQPQCRSCARRPLLSPVAVRESGPWLETPRWPVTAGGEETVSWGVQGHCITSEVVKQPVGEGSPASSKKGIQREACSFTDGYQPARLREKQPCLWEKRYATPLKWQLGCNH